MSNTTRVLRFHTFLAGSRSIGAFHPKLRSPQACFISLPSLARIRAGAYSSTAAPPHLPSPRPRSLLSSLIRFIAIGVTCTTLGFAMATVPHVSDAYSLISPISDAESLTLYEPNDEASSAIDAHILHHPLVESLRQNSSFTESRPFLKIPESARQHHMTSGALGGPGKLVVPPLVFGEEGGKSMVTFFYIGSDLCGWPGIVHGGMLATLLDEGLARCCFPALPNKVGMTATLTVDYRAPTPADSYLVMRAETTKVEGRKAWVEGRIESLPEKEGEPVKVFVEARALFIEPRQAATMAKLYPVATG